MSLDLLIERYQKSLRENPRSRVFAQLGETYRKKGEYDQAITVLKNGIKIHPRYVLAYTNLARCYLELNQHNIAYSLLEPLVEDHLENYKLVSLFALLANELGFSQQSLDYYKILLFNNPKDQFVIDQVSKLEENVQDISSQDLGFIDNDSKELKQNKLSSKSVSALSSSLPPLSTALSNFNTMAEDEWQEIDLSKIPKISKNKEDSPKLINNSIDYSSNELDLPSDDENIKAEVESKSTEYTEKKTDVLPTHSLVDLYYSQGHYQKAHDLLLEIIQSNPDNREDKRIKDRLAQLKNLLKKEITPKKGDLNHTELNQEVDHEVDQEEVDEKELRQDLSSQTVKAKPEVNDLMSHYDSQMRKLSQSKIQKLESLKDAFKKKSLEKSFNSLSKDHGNHEKYKVNRDQRSTD